MDTHWRNTQKPARFFMLDARAFAALFLFLIHARLWTLALAGVVMLLFWLLEQRGLTFRIIFARFSQLDFGNQASRESPPFASALD